MRPVNLPKGEDAPNNDKPISIRLDPETTASLQWPGSPRRNANDACFLAITFPRSAPPNTTGCPRSASLRLRSFNKLLNRCPPVGCQECGFCEQWNKPLRPPPGSIIHSSVPVSSPAVPCAPLRAQAMGLAWLLGSLGWAAGFFWMQAPFSSRTQSRQLRSHGTAVPAIPALVKRIGTSAVVKNISYDTTSTHP